MRNTNSRNTKTLTAIAAGALAATTVTGIAIATTAIADDDTATSEGTTQAPAERTDKTTEGHGPRPHRGGPGEHGGLDSLKGLAGKALGMGMGMLHGEVVVENSDGEYVTQQVQRGAVTAVSDASITVESEDGFAATYAIDADTDQKRDREEGAAQVGDTVHIIGVIDGSTTTADVVAEVVMAMSPEATAEFEAQREAMKDWMSQRPDGIGPKSGMRGRDGRTSAEGTTTPSLAG